jgi:tetratricopeptide (TPR) repeat protein
MMVLVILLTIACAFVPMLNILGYEFAAMIALITCHFAAILVIREFNLLRSDITNRSPFTSGPHSRLVVWGLITGILFAMVWLLLIPLVLIELAGLIFSIRNCDSLTGLIFYLTIPVVSSFFTVSISSFCALITPNRRIAGWLYFFVLIVFFVRVILRFCFGHTIGMHDPFLGTLNLPLYDQEANPDPGFLYSRLLVFITAVFLANLSVLATCDKFQYYNFKNIFSSIWKPERFLPEIQTLLITGILIIVGLYYMGPLGIEVTRNYLEHELDAKVVSEHFIIRYPSHGEVADDIDRIVEQHEFYYWSIFNEIQTAPDGPIRAYIYPDRATKTFLTGVGSSVYAKPWTGEIHVEYDKNQVEALKHELVHVISAPMGLPIFGSSLLGGYGEGIAEGIQWNSENDLSYHAWTAALREADDPFYEGTFFPRDIAPLRLFPQKTSMLSTIMSNFLPGGFYEGRITMNYYVSASYNRWFIDTYGIDAYKIAYIANDTVRAIGLSAQETDEQWMSYLDHVPLKNGEIEFARLAFSPKKFTVQVCAHELAEHERLADEYTAGMDWDSAYNEYTILLNFSPQNPRYAYSQLRTLYYGEKYDIALRGIEQVRSWESMESWKPYLSLLQGDIYARTGQQLPSLDAYRDAYDNALTSDMKNTATLRIKLLESPALDEFLAAFREEDNARWRYERARALDDTWLPVYYLAGSLIADRMYSDAQELYLECLSLNPEYDFIKRSCYYGLGVCAYRAGEYNLARENFNEAYRISENIYLETHSDWDRVIPLDRLDPWAVTLSDWLNRCDWRETYPID